ncbi:unnamed protein product [Effrenium voratum]|nr:unnamed protein product [Effrenium voratum]
MACPAAGSQLDAYTGCLLDCTCGVSNLNYMDYCRQSFALNVTAHDLCLCWTNRCVVRCFAEAGCGNLSNCEALEALMPCNLNCAREGPEPVKPWFWSLDTWPCLSELTVDDPDYTILEPQGSDTWILVTAIGGGIVAIIVLLICCYTCRQMKSGRQTMEAEMYGRA